MKTPRLRHAAIATGTGSLIAAAGLTIREAGTIAQAEGPSHDRTITRWTKPRFALPPVRFDTVPPGDVSKNLRAYSLGQNATSSATTGGGMDRDGGRLALRVPETGRKSAVHKIAAASLAPLPGMPTPASIAASQPAPLSAIVIPDTNGPASPSPVRSAPTSLPTSATLLPDQVGVGAEPAEPVMPETRDIAGALPVADEAPLAQPATAPGLADERGPMTSAKPPELLPDPDIVPASTTAQSGETSEPRAAAEVRQLPRPAFGALFGDLVLKPDVAQPGVSVRPIPPSVTATRASAPSASKAEESSPAPNPGTTAPGNPPSRLPGHSADNPVSRPVTRDVTANAAPMIVEVSADYRPEPLTAADSAKPQLRLPQPAFGQLPDTSTTSRPPCSLSSCTTLGLATGGSGDLAAKDARQSTARSVTASPLARAGMSTSLRAPILTYDNELILAFRMTTGEFEETLSAFGTPQGVYVPLGEVARILDIALPVTDAGHYASGWVIEEKRVLIIDLRQGQIDVGGKTAPIARDEIVAFDDEMYLRADMLARLLPLSVKVDLRDQAILVTTLETFPFQARLQRDFERERLSARGSAQSERHWPRDPAPWRALSFPVIDAEVRGLTDDVYGPRAEFEIHGAADFAFLTARAFLEASSRDGLTGARFELGRKDPDAGLLGPLRATRFAIGDIATTSQAIGLRSVAGRGLTVSNAPLDQTSVFDRIDLRGALPDGYEVELYRNNVLVGSTRAAINGQFEFLQVPVDYGANVMRLVFYGPQGQTREEVRHFSVGDGRLARGQLTYDLSIAQKDVPLLAVRPPLFLANADQGQWRAASDLALGLSSKLTVVAGASATFGTRSPAPAFALSAGLRSEVAGIPFKLDTAWQGSGRFGMRAAAATTLGPFAMALSHAEYRGSFVDEVQAFTDAPLRRASSFDLNGTLPLGANGLPLIGRFAQRTFQDNRRLAEVTLRSAVRFGQVLISPGLEYSASSGAGLRTSRLAGGFDLTVLAGSRTRLRGSAALDFTHKLFVNSLGAEVDHALSDRDSARLSASHSFEGHQTQFALSFGHRFTNATLALDANMGLHTRSYGLGLRFSAGFLRHPFDGHVLARQPGLTSGGLLATRTFRDENANGRFDSGEMPLAGVTVEAGNRYAVTDSRGLALIDGLVDANRTVYQIDADTLPDIALAPARRAAEFVARAGSVQAADIAIVPLAEIEGEAIFAGETDRKGVSGLRLVLVGEDGKVRASARSRAGGSFLFERIVPGLYRIDLQADQAARLGLRLESPVEVDIRPDQDIYRPLLVVTRLAN